MDADINEGIKENIPNIKFISDNLLSGSNSRNKNLASTSYLTRPSYNTPAANMILEKNLHSIFMEHCYSRPHTWRPEAHFLRPTKTLFMPTKTVIPIKGRRRSYNTNQEDDEIDVETVQPEKTITTYDIDKANFLMDECERHAKFARVDEEDQVWDENVPRLNWTANQTRLFANIVDILNAEYMARLAYKGAHNEPVIRRSLIEKTVKRYRLLMSTISWDLKLSQWLHQVLTDYTSIPYLAIYLDMLQTLKSKLPTFTDRLMFGPNQLNRVGVTSTESLFPLLKRRWDPFSATIIPQQTNSNLTGSPSKPTSTSSDNGPTGVPKRLPSNAVIVVVPGGPTNSNNGKRLSKWIVLLNQLAPTYPVFANLGSGGSRMTILTCLEQMFASTRAKVQEVKADHPNRNLILLGIQGAGAALALQVAQVENVLCCVCIGFGLHTADGRRGQPDDQMMELQAPVLFVVGQCATTARQEEMEDLRERMRVETGLLMIGGADDYLRLSKKKRRAEGVTQSFVDRCIIEEIGNFASDILLSPYPPQMRQSPTHQSTATTSSTSAAAAATAAVRNFAATHLDHNRKRNNSNGSSLDSEPPSPLPQTHQHMQHQLIGQQKSTRPVGRPPGSTSKGRVSNKWTTFSQGTSTPTPIATLSTSSSSSTNNSNTKIGPTSLANQIPPPAYPDFPSNSKLTQQQQQKISHQQQYNNDNTIVGNKISVDTGKSVSGGQVTPEKQPKVAAGGGESGAGGIKSPTVTAKLQALANRGVISHNIINTSSGIRTIPPKSVGTIKVLNNITIASTPVTTMSNLGKPILATQTTSSTSQLPPTFVQHRPTKAITAGGTTYGSLVLMSDGKLKNCGTSQVVKGVGSTPILFPLNSSSNALSSSTPSPLNVSAGAAIRYSSSITVPPSKPIAMNASSSNIVNSVHRMRPKYITSKNQLISNRITGQKQIKTIPFIQTTQTTTLNSTLPPPTNLTSQEIMDLPIIFADDDNTPSNQVLQNATDSSVSSLQTNQILTIPCTSKPQGKLVIVNKTNNMLPHNVLKRPAGQCLQKSVGSGVKYAKIILSKCPPTILNDDQRNKQPPIGTSLQLPTDLSIKRDTTATNVKLEEPFDLEKELVATAVVKPSCGNVDPKMMTFIYKGDTNAEVKEHLSTCTNAEIKKMLESKDEI